MLILVIKSGVVVLQLYSLNDYKPPISKAKMTQITKAAIKAIKVGNSLSCLQIFSIGVVVIFIPLLHEHHLSLVQDEKEAFSF